MHVRVLEPISSMQVDILDEKRIECVDVTNEYLKVLKMLLMLQETTKMLSQNFINEIYEIYLFVDWSQWTRDRSSRHSS